MAGRYGRGRNNSTWQDGCIRGSLISDPTQRERVRKLRHHWFACQMKNQPKFNTRVRSLAVPNEAACDTTLSFGHSRVGGDSSMLLQYSRSFCLSGLRQPSPVAAVLPCLRAKVITQLCTRSIALFSPRQTSHMPSFQPSSELSLSLPLDP